MISLRYRLFRVAAIAVVAAALPYAKADQYGLLNAFNPSFDDVSAWYNYTTGSAATQVPGLLDFVGMQNFNNFGTTVVNLRDNRSNDGANIYGLSFMLNGNAYSVTNGLDLYDGTIGFGTFNVGYLQVNGYGASVTSYLTGLTATGQGINVSDGATLEITNSTLAFESLGTYSPTATALLSLVGTTSTGKYGNFAGDLSVDATSSLKFEGSGTPYVYASALYYESGTFNLAGSLETVGATFAQSNFTTTPTATINVTGSSASWTDQSDSIVSLGFGGLGNLNIDGGTVNIKTGIRVGEGNYYTDASNNFVGVNGTGSVNVSNGGTLETSSLGLSGQYRNVSFSGQPLATSSGSLSVVSNGLVRAQTIDAYDSTGLGPSYATIDVNTGGRLEVNSLLAGAVNLDSGATATSFALDVSNGGHFKANFAQFIGGIGGNVVADFSGASTTVEIANLSSTVGAYVTLDGVQATLGNVSVGYDFKPGGNLAIRNTNLTLDGGPNGGTFRLINAYSGTMSVQNSTVSVGADQVPSISVGSFNGGTTLGTLNWDSTDYSGPGTFNAATNGTLNIKSSTILLHDYYSPITGVVQSRGVVNVGFSDGIGRANITDSTISGWRFRTGDGATSEADVVIKNSTIEARADQFASANPGSIIIGNDGKSTVEIFGSSLNGPQVYIGSKGLLKGDGTLQGLPLSANPTTNVINNGTISPGHSPGHLTIIGDLTNNGTLEMEVDLSNPGNYDFLTVTGALNLGGKLKLKALGTGTFDPTRSYTFFTASNFTGNFASYEIDPAFGISASAFSFNGTGFGINPAQAVPEPASIVAISAGLVAMLRRKRK